MEDALEAAATLIRYIGEVAINSKYTELSALVEAVEQAAEAADVQYEELSGLGDELKLADQRDRMTTVVKLGDAAASLERIGRAPVVALRDSAASLSRECQAFLEAYQSIEKLRRARDERAHHTAARPRRSGWLSMLGKFGTEPAEIRENLLRDVEKNHQDLEDSFIVTVDLLLTEERLLKEKIVKLINQAQEITITAKAMGVPPDLCTQLLGAMDAMEQADETQPSFVVDLEAAATAIEGAVTTLSNLLTDSAAELVHACVELKKAQDAMVTIQEAAAEQKQAWTVTTHREGGIAGVAATSDPGKELVPGQGESKRSAMTAYALYGSITLITYLGPENVVNKVKEQTHLWRNSFHVVFSLWWTSQAVGTLVSAYARSLVELRISQVLCRLGVLGLNLLVIGFLYTALDIDSKLSLWLLLGVAVCFHLSSFALVYWRGDLSK